MKILLVDDHKLFREGLRLLLQSGLADDRPPHLLEASDLASALELARDHADLDIVLLDLNLPDTEGLSALETFARQFPVLPLIVLSASTHHGDIRRCIEIGAMGFIPKDSASSAVISAIRLVESGNIYVPPTLLQSAAPSDMRTTQQSALTDRQRQVLQLIAEGKSNKVIAGILSLSEATVKMHVSHIMRNLEVSNRTQALVKAEKMGLVELH